MDASLPADLKISAVSSTDFEDWFTLVLELWPEEDEADCKDMRDKMMTILDDDNQTEWLVRDSSGDAMAKPLRRRIAFMNLSLRQDYVPGATQRPVAFIEGIYIRSAWRFLSGGETQVAYPSL